MIDRVYGESCLQRHCALLSFDLKETGDSGAVGESILPVNPAGRLRQWTNITQKMKSALQALLVLADEAVALGGYRPVKKPAEVSISELPRTIDSPIAPLPCLSRRACQR